MDCNSIKSEQITLCVKVVFGMFLFHWEISLRSVIFKLFCYTVALLIGDQISVNFFYLDTEFVQHCSMTGKVFLMISPFIKKRHL